MAIHNKAPIWQRVISALLTLGVMLAFVTRALDGELDTWPKVGVVLAALYGGYVFGYFALRGHLPGVLAGKRGGAGDA